MMTEGMTLAGTPGSGGRVFQGWRAESWGLQSLCLGLQAWDSQGTGCISVAELLV